MKDRQLCQSNCHHEITPTVLSYQEQGTYTNLRFNFCRVKRLRFVSFSCDFHVFTFAVAESDRIAKALCKFLWDETFAVGC